MNEWEKKNKIHRVLKYWIGKMRNVLLNLFPIIIKGRLNGLYLDLAPANTRG